MNRFKVPTITAIVLSFLICSVLLISNLLSAEPQNQQTPLIRIHDSDGDKEIDLIYELKKAEIIPTVLDEFNPTITISIEWDSAEASYGNTIAVAKTKNAPTVELLDQGPSLQDQHPQLTLIITDPDAPSRDEPSHSEFCHWIATAIPLTSPDNDGDNKGEEGVSSDLEEVVPYRPPGPPEKTGKHRYVFVALAPLNGTTEKLHLRAPEERGRWGFEHERMGVREWAKEMGLGVVGANFIYEQNEVQ